MAFKRTQTPSFSTPVTVKVPNDRAGFDKNTFVAKFQRPSTDDLETLRGLPNEELVRKQLIGWELKDEETGEDVPFTKENMEAILQIQPTPLATALAFWETVNGARTKN